MKKSVRITAFTIIVLLIGVIVFTLSAAGVTKTAKKVTKPKAAAVKSPAKSATEKTFTLSDLAKYNGQNGSPAYVAVNGTVYDVSNANGWHNGEHFGGVKAGQDLTDALSKSPHGDKVLKSLPVVGKIKK